MVGALCKVALFGECMLEFQGAAFDAMQQGFGGDSLNTAVYLARCGRDRGIAVSYATGLGDDRWSAALMERWTAEHVGLDLVRCMPGRLPGLYLIEVDGHGERTFSYWRDSSAAKAYFDVAQTPLEATLDHWDALYVSGISLAILPPDGQERLLAAMQAVRRRGGCVVFDNNFRPRLWPDRAQALDCYARAFALANIALVTADDHQSLHQMDSLDQAVEHAQYLPSEEIVIKRGADATMVRSPEGEWGEAATEHVPQVVDTTAAGDSFAAGYLSRRLSGASSLDAARFGNRLAARVIQHRGALIPAQAMADLVSCPSARAK